MAKDLPATILTPERGGTVVIFDGEGSSRSVGVRVSYDPKQGYTVNLEGLAGNELPDFERGVELRYVGG